MPETFVANSSALDFAQYDPETDIMKVWFAKGGTARYPVSRVEFEGLKTASSVGRYFNAVIRPKGSF